MKKLGPGKLRHDFLENLLGKIVIEDRRVIVGPGIGEDAAALDFGDHYLIVKCDPITFVADRIGFYVVNINANDIAAMGGTPKWFLATVLLPDKKTTLPLVQNIMKDLRGACSELGITLIGGHTEVTHGLENPILSGTMLGEVKKDELIKNGDIREGDLLYMTKGVAIEATSIIAREKKGEVIDNFGKGFYKRCLSFLENPGISVVEDAKCAKASARVTGMHDPTEGGILTGAYEMARSSGMGLTIYLDKIPVYEETRKLCEHFNISPYASTASGSLLISVPKEDGEKLERVFVKQVNGMPYISMIGEFKGSGEPVHGILKGRKKRILPTGRDEIMKIL